jgi:hypothetical protein
VPTWVLHRVFDTGERIEHSIIDWNAGRGPHGGPARFPVLTKLRPNELIIQRHVVEKVNWRTPRAILEGTGKVRLRCDW